MLDLASQLSALPPEQGESQWADHEYVRGWGVFGLPFDSGHVLALRVFPSSDFGAYRTLWHRDPDGNWAIYVHGPRLETACPRYYGNACRHTGFATLDLEWTGPATLRVTMDSPAVEWTLTASSTPTLTLLNGLSSALPLSTWRHRSLIRLRERIAGRLGLGQVEMQGIMPSGHTGTLMPKKMFFIEESRATFDGVELGRPVQLKENPRIGNVPLPARGMLSVGQAMWQILDEAEHSRSVSRSGT